MGEARCPECMRSVYFEGNGKQAIISHVKVWHKDVYERKYKMFDLRDGNLGEGQEGS